MQVFQTYFNSKDKSIQFKDEKRLLQNISSYETFLCTLFVSCVRS